MVELKNNKQEQFAKEYLIDLNATQAAIRAGYSRKTAYSQGQRLLKNVEIQTRISELMNERSRRTEITADRVIQEIAKIAFSDIGEYMTWDQDGNITMLSSDNLDTSVIQAIKSNRTLRPIGDGEEVIDSSLEVKFHPKLKALELLYNHVNGSDKLSKAQVRKAIAEAKIIENKADKLTAGGKVNNLLQALLDVKSGGDGSNGTEV